MFWLVLLYPFIEITFSLWVVDEIGLLEGVYWLLLAFFVGLALLRFVGLNLPQRLQTELVQGKTGNSALIRSALRFLAGVFFIIPGMLSDFFAIFFLLLSLLPKIEIFTAYFFQRMVRSRVVFTSHRPHSDTFYSTYTYTEDGFRPPMRDVTPLKPDELPESKNKDEDF